MSGLTGHRFQNILAMLERQFADNDTVSLELTIARAARGMACGNAPSRICRLYDKRVSRWASEGRFRIP